MTATHHNWHFCCLSGQDERRPSLGSCRLFGDEDGNVSEPFIDTVSPSIHLWIVHLSLRRFFCEIVDYTVFEAWINFCGSLIYFLVRGFGSTIELRWTNESGSCHLPLGLFCPSIFCFSICYGLRACLVSSKWGSFSMLSIISLSRK